MHHLANNGTLVLATALLAIAIFGLGYTIDAAISESDKLLGLLTLPFFVLGAAAMALLFQ